MSEIAIRVEKLGKRYRIGHLQERHNTLRDLIASKFQRANHKSEIGSRKSEVGSWKSEVGNQKSEVGSRKSEVGNQKSEVGSRKSEVGNQKSDDTFWALKDVSFEVKRGEVVGVIGRNGAGKSTLLKILSRITEPTEGFAEIHGRMGTLLEVGTGFHPELTGRENILLSGAIMGMKRAEIERKFDEIVAFAEVEKFIDTPVKRYSSGMYVRLAFAVAAHLEPEILLVDEVLAVGDAAFQKKCLGKMGEVAREGRTILFVSHNMLSILNMCQRCVYLEEGHMVTIGDTLDVVGKYNEVIRERLQLPISERPDRHGTGKVILTRIAILDSAKNEVPFLYPGQPCYIQADVELHVPEIRDLQIGVGIDTTEGVRLLTLYSYFVGQSFDTKERKVSLTCSLENGLNLRHGHYMIPVSLDSRQEVLDFVYNAVELEIREADFFGTGHLPDKRQGPILVAHTWAMES